jgi:hypothetical protein
MLVLDSIVSISLEINKLKKTYLKLNMKNCFLFIEAQTVAPIKKAALKIVIINTRINAINVLVILPLLIKFKMKQSKRIQHIDLGY